jgi:hypothetical protein
MRTFEGDVSWTCPYPPATEQEIIGHMAMLDAVLPSERSDVETRSFRLQVLAADLAGFPAIVIERACEAIRRDRGNVFFPSSAMLREECEAQYRGLAYAHGYRPYRARPASPGPLLAVVPSHASDKPPSIPVNPDAVTDTDLALLAAVRRRHGGP